MPFAAKVHQGWFKAGGEPVDVPVHPTLVCVVTLDVGVDIGGTFTDLFGVDSETGRVFQAKSLTTPRDLSEGVFDCLEKASISTEAIGTLVHGSTVAINIAIERTGARSALVVTDGTRDVYAIGRGNRPEAYNPFFKRPEPLIDRSATFEVAERKLASGGTRTALTEAHATDVAHAVAAAGVEAVAVCFLHSYADPEHEELMGRVLRRVLPDAHISLSNEIIREYREYERMSTTALNAYIGPRASEYLAQIEGGLAERDFRGRFLIMQSNGGVMSPETAKRTPVAMMESGPVGGVIASVDLGESAGYRDIITFDMGGTTAKSSLIRDAVPTIAHGYHIGGYARGHPAMLPVVDIVEVGAGGGSIAWLDEVGSLKVGPRSAGAAPGPICYRRGGSEPTVTDANVVLGRIGAEAFLGGEMVLDAAGARAGIAERLAPLGLDPTEAAIGIVRLAVANMVLAVRAVSVERGYDPRDFVLMAQGGNGPLHALEIARELSIPTVVIPRLPAIFSAVGMLMADLRHDYVQTHYTGWADVDLGVLEDEFAELVRLGTDRLADEGVDASDMTFEHSLDLRYVGQEFTLAVAVTPQELAARDREAIRSHFNRAHEHRYGYATAQEEIEMVNLRVVAKGARPRPSLPPTIAGDADSLIGHRPVWFSDPAQSVDCAVHARDRLAIGAQVHGPAVIEEATSTTLLWPGDVATVAPGEELVVTVGAA
jgi:N-methylhydantoinase A